MSDDEVVQGEVVQPLWLTAGELLAGLEGLLSGNPALADMPVVVETHCCSEALQMVEVDAEGFTGRPGPSVLLRCLETPDELIFRAVTS
jgi:hypothetical protein